MKKVYLVDVSSMFFRAYYAIPPLTNSKGTPTNALQGFMSMTLKLLREIKPEYLAFCFDRKEASFRAELYEDYKANRGEMPEDLKPQIPYIKDLTDYLGIPRFDMKDYEADDVIGSLAKFGEAEKQEVVIVSGDKDFAQLVSTKTTMYDPMRENRYDLEGVTKKWGIDSTQMIDYLALVGDASDNIPGVYGVGPKTAQKLLAEHKTLEGVYENVDAMKKSKLKERLIEHKKDAFLSQELVTIVTDLDFDIKLDDLKPKPYQDSKLIELLDELELFSLKKSLFKENVGQFPVTEKKTKKVSGKKSSKKDSEPKEIKKSKGTKKLKVIESNADLLSEAIDPYSVVTLFNLDKKIYIGQKKNIYEISDDFKSIANLLSKKLTKHIGYNLKQTWRLMGYKKPLDPVFDVLLGAYVIASEPSLKLEDLADKYMGLNNVDSPEDYHLALLGLKEEFEEKIKSDELDDIYEDVEAPLLPVLNDMEDYGILLDKSVLEKQEKVLAKQARSLEEKIHMHAGEEFNVASPKQLGVILFEKLELPVIKKTKTGYSTNSDVLNKLKDKHPICQLVIEFRELTKLLSTYIIALQDLADEKTSRIHTTFNQAVTTTGRLSSTNPNLQNIPIRTERGEAIRKSFVAPKGKLILAVDYSQIELRVLAHISEDKGLTSAFKNNLDVHAATAAEVFGVDLKDVTPELRRKAKAVNFGIAYGQGAYGLAEGLGISRKEGKEIIENYFKKFSSIKAYMDETIEFATDEGYVESIFGRRVYVRQIQSDNPMLKKFGERAAINAPMQATASDIVKLAMVELYNKLPIPMLVQIHDELLFECPEDDIEYYAQKVKEIMEGVVELDVPLVANVAWGKNWQEAHA